MAVIVFVGGKPTSVLQATVLLSANVGFLAIQSIDNTVGSSHRSFAQLASYASGLLSLANIAVVLILLRRHRQHLYDTASRGVSGLIVSTRPLAELLL